MNWTLKLLIDEVETEVFPILNAISLNLSKENDQIFNRIKSSGNAIFFENDFDLVYNLSKTNRQIDAYLYCDNVLQSNCLLQLDGTFDIDKKVAELELIINDKYKLLIDAWDDEVNVLTLPNIPDKYNVLADLAQHKLEFYQDFSIYGSAITIRDGFFGFYSEVLDINTQIFIFAREIKVFNTYEEASYFDGTDGWEFLTGTNNTLVRDWRYAIPKYKNASSVSTSDLYLFENTLLEYGIQYPDNNRYLSNYTVIGVANFPDLPLQPIIRSYLLRNESFYDTPQINYSRNLLLKDVITLLISYIDENVHFDSNSYAYFDNNDKFKYLFLSNITDFILVTDDTTGKSREKDNAATISNISLSIIFDYLRELYSIYWYLDDDNYFRLVHILDYTYNPVLKPCHDLTTNRGINWSIANNKYTIDRSEQYSQINRKLTAGNPDFVGKDLVYSNVKKNKKEITISSVFTDVDDIQFFKSKYPDTSNNQFVFLACEPYQYNMIKFFNNDNTYPFEKLNGVTLTTGQELINQQFNNLENTTGPGILKSNYFPLQKNQSITFTFNLSNFTNIGYIILYDNDKLLKVIEFGTENTFTYLCENSSIYGNIRIECNPGIYSFDGISIYGTNQFAIRKNYGFISNKSDVQNVELSLSNSDYYDFAEHSDTDVEINGELVAVDSSMIKKFKEQNNLTTPTNNFANDFDSLQYVKTDLTENGIIKEITKKLDNSLSKITLKFYE